MANGRDKTKMKNVSVWLTVEFKERLKVMAEKRKMTVSDLIRELLAKEYQESGNIGSQRKDAE